MRILVLPIAAAGIMVPSNEFSSNPLAPYEAPLQAVHQAHCGFLPTTARISGRLPLRLYAFPPFLSNFVGRELQSWTQEPTDNLLARYAIFSSGDIWASIKQFRTGPWRVYFALGIGIATLLATLALLVYGAYYAVFIIPWWDWISDGGDGKKAAQKFLKRNRLGLKESALEQSPYPTLTREASLDDYRPTSPLADAAGANRRQGGGLERRNAATCRKVCVHCETRDPLKYRNRFCGRQGGYRIGFMSVGFAAILGVCIVYPLCALHGLKTVPSLSAHLEEIRCALAQSAWHLTFGSETFGPATGAAISGLGMTSSQQPTLPPLQDETITINPRFLRRTLDTAVEASQTAAMAPNAEWLSISRMAPVQTRSVKRIMHVTHTWPGLAYWYEVLGEFQRQVAPSLTVASPANSSLNSGDLVATDIILPPTLVENTGMVLSEVKEMLADAVTTAFALIDNVKISIVNTSDALLHEHADEFHIYPLGIQLAQTGNDVLPRIASLVQSTVKSVTSSLDSLLSDSFTQRIQETVDSKASQLRALLAEYVDTYFPPTLEMIDKIGRGLHLTNAYMRPVFCGLVALGLTSGAFFCLVVWRHYRSRETLTQVDLCRSLGPMTAEEIVNCKRFCCDSSALWAARVLAAAAATTSPQVVTRRNSSAGGGLSGRTSSAPQLPEWPGLLQKPPLTDGVLDAQWRRTGSLDESTTKSSVHSSKEHIPTIAAAAPASLGSQISPAFPVQRTSSSKSSAVVTAGGAVAAASFPQQVQPSEPLEVELAGPKVFGTADGAGGRRRTSKFRNMMPFTAVKHGGRPRTLHQQSHYFADHPLRCGLGPVLPPVATERWPPCPCSNSAHLKRLVKTANRLSHLTFAYLLISTLIAAVFFITSSAYFGATYLLGQPCRVSDSLMHHGDFQDYPIIIDSTRKTLEGIGFSAPHSLEEETSELNKGILVNPSRPIVPGFDDRMLFDAAEAAASESREAWAIRHEAMQHHPNMFDSLRHFWRMLHPAEPPSPPRRQFYGQAYNAPAEARLESPADATERQWWIQLITTNVLQPIATYDGDGDVSEALERWSLLQTLRDECKEWAGRISEQNVDLSSAEGIQTYTVLLANVASVFLIDLARIAAAPTPTLLSYPDVLISGLQKRDLQLPAEVQAIIREHVPASIQVAGHHIDINITALYGLENLQRRINTVLARLNAADLRAGGLPTSYCLDAWGLCEDAAGSGNDSSPPPDGRRVITGDGASKADAALTSVIIAEKLQDGLTEALLWRNTVAWAERKVKLLRAKPAVAADGTRLTLQAFVGDVSALHAARVLYENGSSDGMSSDGSSKGKQPSASRSSAEWRPPPNRYEEYSGYVGGISTSDSGLLPSDNGGGAAQDSQSYLIIQEGSGVEVMSEEAASAASGGRLFWSTAASVPPAAPRRLLPGTELQKNPKEFFADAPWVNMIQRPPSLSEAVAAESEEAGDFGDGSKPYINALLQESSQGVLSWVADVAHFYITTGAKLLESVAPYGADRLAAAAGTSKSILAEALTVTDPFCYGVVEQFIQQGLVTLFFGVGSLVGCVIVALLHRSTRRRCGRLIHELS